MKILLFGEYSSNGNMILGYYQKAFAELGHEVKFLSMSSDGSDKSTSNNLQALQNTYPYHIAQRIIRRINHMTTSFRAKSLITRSIGVIEDFKPDIALTSQGGKSQLWPLELLDAFDQREIPVFNYFTDPVPENDVNFLKTIPYYTGIFTYNSHYIPTWYWYGAKHVTYIPFASDEGLHVPKKPKLELLDYYRSPISYLGTWQPNIEIWPNIIQPYGLKIWGNQWSKLPSSHPLRKSWQGEDKGLFEEFSLICSASDIIFNVVRAFNGQGHSMKTFEIPACKGFAITNRTEQQLDFFPEDKACVYFSTAEELIDKIKYYLKNEKSRKKIMDAAYEISLKHRYKDRARDMLIHFNEVI